MILLAGPTASGKSEVALLMAEQVGGEIISVDSMQVYCGMDIGTAKPSAEERRRVRHHLIDVLDLTEPFDAAQFVRLAHRAVTEIRERGHVPIVCGGTGLYFKAFLEGLGEAPPADQELRATLEKIPLADLLVELEQRDPETFSRVDRQNRRRVVRAIEVIRVTGQPFSQQRSNWQMTSSPSPPLEERVGEGRPLILGLRRERDDLHQRINNRVDAMFRNGLVAETESLLRRGLSKNKVASQALGYRQVIEHLKGALSLAETIDLVKLRTRQFAKRQMTWFRHQLPIRWIDVSPNDSADRVAGRIKAELA